MLDDLLADVNRQGGNAGSTGLEPVVSLELFFEGNDDPGSIGCNLTDHPGVDRFYAVLRGIRDRPDVHGVRSASPKSWAQMSGRSATTSTSSPPPHPRTSQSGPSNSTRIRPSTGGPTFLPSPYRSAPTS